MGRGVECGLEGDVPECGATDAEDDEVFVLLSVLGDGFDRVDMLGAHGFVPELAPAFPSGASGLGEVGGHRFDPRGGV